MRVRSQWIAGIAALLVLCGAAWKPGALQKAIVDRLLAKLNGSTPYQIRIDGASGDFIHHIALNGVHVSARGETAELLQARVLDLSIKWSDLLHRRLELRRLKLIEPTLFLTLDTEGRLQWPQARHRRPRMIRTSRFPFSASTSRRELSTFAIARRILKKN